MIQIKLLDVLNAKGKTVYWLADKCDISTNALYKLANNNTTSIKFETLDRIMTVLNCTADDLIEHTQD